MKAVLVAPPNAMPRIGSIWAYLSVDASGNEGVCAAPLMGPGSLVPMIAADQARLASLTPIAEQIAEFTGMTITLVEFTARVEHRAITGKSDG